MLKNLFSKSIIYMITLINALHCYGFLSLNWKKVIFYLKKCGKDKSTTVTYISISFLTSLSKMFEKGIHLILLNYLYCKAIILKFKFTFKKHHSKTHQILRFYAKKVINLKAMSHRCYFY